MLSRFPRRWLFGLLLTLSASAQAATLFEIPEKSAISLGDGLNLVTMEVASACVKGAVKTSRSIKTEYYVDQSLNPLSVVDKLFTVGRFNTKSWGDSVLDRLYRHQYTAKRRTLYYLVKVTDSEAVIDIPKFDRSRINQGLCGDAWVDRVVTGGYLLMGMHLDFVSESDAQKVASYAAFDSLSLGKLRSFLQNLSFDVSDGVQLSFEMEQVGGDPAHLLQLFQQDKAVLSCRYPDVDDCLDLAQKARDYMVNPQAFVGQFINHQDAPNRYLSLRAWQGQTPDWGPLFLTRDRLNKIGRATQAALRRLNERLTAALQTPMQEVIEQGITRLDQQLDPIKKARANCFAMGNPCNNIEAMIPERQDIIDADSFLELCGSKYKTASLNIFVDFVKRKYGDLSCSGLNEKLTMANELSLVDLSLDQLFFLNGLNYLERLDLSNNHLAELSTLPYLPRLYELNVNNNRLTTLKGLANAPALIKLQAEHNQLKLLDIPAYLPNLAGLRALDNPLSNPKEERQRLGKIPAVYLAPSDICDVYRQWVYKRHMIGSDDLETYRQLDFTPIFNDKLKKNTVQNWVNCQAAYNSYSEIFPDLELFH